MGRPANGLGLPGRAIARILGAAALTLALVASACSASGTSSGSSSPADGTPAQLNVSAAATLRRALTTIAPEFEKANNVKLAINYGASGVLMRQIEAGSPTDVFLSAGAMQVDTLVAEGIVSADATVTFAGNDLAILVAKGNPGGIHGPDDLSAAGELTTGDPAVAPHGTKAREWLVGIGLWDTLRPRFVFTANAAQTDDYVARGEADAGIGFRSDAVGRSDIDVAYTVPDGQITPIKYVAAPVRGSSDPALASRLATFMLSPKAQRVLADAGFTPVSPVR